MITCRVIETRDVHLNILKHLYDSNKKELENNAKSNYKTVLSSFTQDADTQLTAEMIRDSDGTIAGYTTGIVTNDVWHCKNVIVDNNKVFILSAKSAHEELSKRGIKYIKGHGIHGTPMHSFLVSNMGRNDLFSSESGSLQEGHDNIVVTMKLL